MGYYGKVVAVVACVAVGLVTNTDADCTVRKWDLENPIIPPAVLRSPFPSKARGDRLGNKVDVLNGRALIAAPKEQQRGSVYFLGDVERSGKFGIVEEERFTGNSSDTVPDFGSAISLGSDGSWASGSPQADDGNGAVYLFDAGGKLVKRFSSPSNNLEFEKFGNTISYSTSSYPAQLAVSTFSVGFESNVVYIYEKTAQGWSDTPTHEVPSPWYFSPLGLTITENTLIMAAPAIAMDSAPGEVAVFSKNMTSGTWNPTPQILNDNDYGCSNDFFCGNSFGVTHDLSENGLCLAVGSTGQIQSLNLRQGVVYVYCRPDVESPFVLDETFRGRTIERDPEDPSPPYVFDNIGSALALSFSSTDQYTLAFTESDAQPVPTPSTSTVKVYEKPHGASKWMLTAVIENPETSGQRHFGASLSLSGPHLLIGIPFLNDGTTLEVGGALLVQRSGYEGCNVNCSDPALDTSSACMGQKGCYWAGSLCRNAHDATSFKCLKYEESQCHRRPWCIWENRFGDGSICHGQV